ncbi:hypothetical protein, partial [Salmonella enterica]|uniref:hypothetical protein n=1 Tax=Salmonella enterica TaxID=28901 RepID=UPI001EE95253
MREKYKMQAGGGFLSEIAACRDSSRRGAKRGRGTGEKGVEIPGGLFKKRGGPGGFHFSKKKRFPKGGGRGGKGGDFFA